MATWKKVIVSGSTAAFANVINDGIASNQVVVGAGAGANQVGSPLTAGQILMGNASAVPTGTSVSGDITLSNAGVATIGSDKVTTAMLSGSVADTPVAGQTVKVGANGAFTFDDASTLLSAGLGITITNNKISSSIANPGSVVENPGNSFGTLATTEFTGSFTGSGLISSAIDATNATNTTKVNLSDNESTDENNVLVFGAGASATGNTALETDGDLTYNPGKSRLSVPQVTASAGFKGNVTGNVTGNLTGTVQTAAQGNITSVGTLTSLDVSGNTTLGNAATDTVTIAGDLIVQGNTTEVQTTNLNVKDALILLSSGSSGATKQDSGLIFSGNNIGLSVDAPAVNSGSALFVDSTLKRLSVTADGTHAGASATSLTVGGFVPLVTTGSQTSFDQIGNFKVNSTGDLFVYAG